jgi:glycosyltransferase involved in cell wall biosynthesis
MQIEMAVMSKLVRVSAATEILSRARARAQRAGRRLKSIVRRLARGSDDDCVAAARIRELLLQYRYDDASSLAESLLPKHDQDRHFLRQASAAFEKSGAITPQLEVIRAQRRMADTEDLARREAIALGKWLETSASWSPKVRAAPEPLVATSSGRILHLLKAAAPYRQSGYTMRAKYTLQAQLAAGLEPVALTSLRSPKSASSAGGQCLEEIDGVRHIWLNGEVDAPYDQSLSDLATGVADCVRELAPAAIHVHSGHRGYELALVALALGKHFSIPVVYEVRGFFESIRTAHSEWSYKSEIFQRRLATENRCMSSADAVVTLSESMRAEIISRGIDPAKVCVVPNGVDVDMFQPKSRPAALVDRYGLTDRFVFGYVSNLDHFREGQETLIDAALALRDRGVPATALIIGDGKRRDLLERYATDRSASETVLFTGKVPHEEILSFYSLLDVFVVPRVDERAARLVTPLKPFEAMAAGIPLVTSDLEALREVTGDGERGRHYPPGNPTFLADVLQSMYADPESARRMASRARDWVIAERQWSANGLRYARLYADLLSGDVSD